MLREYLGKRRRVEGSPAHPPIQPEGPLLQAGLGWHHEPKVSGTITARCAWGRGAQGNSGEEQLTLAGGL